MARKDFDVIVAGGGPAGSTVATLLAQHGRRVLLAEKSMDPEFKIGESLMPATYWTLERLGMLDKMRSSRFPQKRSVQFYRPDGQATAPFYFHEFDDHESSRTWQVVRSEFDQMLLENAAEQGVEIRRGWNLREVLFDGEQAVGARFRMDTGAARNFSASVVVDATGQSHFLASKMGLRTIEPRLRNVSFYTHYEGAERGEGIDEGATVILHTVNGDSWFWYIPLPGDRMSVGVVGPVDHLIMNRIADPERVFAEELAKCPALQTKLASARSVEPVRAIRDFSYGASRVAGPGWVLAGDAFGFIDPIYSSGVFLALKSGELAADAIHEALDAGDLSAERLGAFEPELRRGSDALRKLVYAFYDEEFHFGRFLRRYPDCREQLVDLLMGNVFRKPVAVLLRALDETLGRTVEAPSS